VANIASSKKDARRSAVRAVRNRSLKSSVKTKVGKFRRAASEGAEDTEQLALTAVSALDRAASKGVIHANNAARRKSRLMKRLKATAVPAAPAPKPTKPTKATKAPKAAPRKKKTST
jgi:small subunit ribosomal protein S20